MTLTVKLQEWDETAQSITSSQGLEPFEYVSQLPQQFGRMFVG
ncbi:hypothetical protein [Komarekiella delphini-convector]|nr:hypothetical protein [Komarekiella delphini-convector]